MAPCTISTHSAAIAAHSYEAAGDLEEHETALAAEYEAEQAEIAAVEAWIAEKRSAARDERLRLGYTERVDMDGQLPGAGEDVLVFCDAPGIGLGDVGHPTMYGLKWNQKVVGWVGVLETGIRRYVNAGRAPILLGGCEILRRAQDDEEVGFLGHEDDEDPGTPPANPNAWT